MRHITDNGLKLIEGFESLRLHAYYDDVGILTIGYGHTGHDVTIGQIIIEAQADELMRCDVLTAERAVMRYITRPLTDNQFDALVSFTFNTGAGTLQHSTLRMKCNARADNAVPAQFKRYVHGGGRILPGLVTRRRLEAALYSH